MSKVLLMIKEIGRNNRRMVLVKVGVIFVVAAMITTTALFLLYSNDINEGLAQNIIRLHVVANSDSPEDQKLKTDVRDAVLEYMKEELKNSNNLYDTKRILHENLENITAIAQAKTTQYEKEYTVDAVIGSYPFPTKSYGDVTLPAGNYEALKVVIGKGEGANWWCVLFPPLCFVDATHGTVPDSVKDNLKAALTEEEYSIIVSASDEGDIPIRLKFKIVELLQNSKVRFAGMMSKIFNSFE